MDSEKQEGLQDPENKASISGQGLDMERCLFRRVKLEVAQLKDPKGETLAAETYTNAIDRAKIKRVLVTRRRSSSWSGASSSLDDLLGEAASLSARRKASFKLILDDDYSQTRPTSYLISHNPH